MTHWAKMVDITGRTLEALGSDPQKTWSLGEIVATLNKDGTGIEVDEAEVRDALMRLASRSLLVYGPDRRIHVDQPNLKRYAQRTAATL
jgi:hypothetical protein